MQQSPSRNFLGKLYGFHTVFTYRYTYKGVYSCSMIHHNTYIDYTEYNNYYV